MTPEIAAATEHAEATADTDPVEVLWTAEATVRQVVLHEPEPALGPVFGRLRRVSEVGELAVLPEVWRAGAFATQWAASSLMLEREPAVTWFTPERVADRAYWLKYGNDDEVRSLLIDTTTGLLGTVDVPTWEVWLRFDLTVEKAIDTAAHEVCHLAQVERGEKASGTAAYMRPLEFEAYQYAADVKDAIHRAWLKQEENR